MKPRPRRHRQSGRRRAGGCFTVPTEAAQRLGPSGGARGARRAAEGATGAGARGRGGVLGPRGGVACAGEELDDDGDATGDGTESVGEDVATWKARGGPMGLGHCEEEEQ